MKCLVTGGGGFLGRYIVKALQERGDDVRILARGAYPELSKTGVDCMQGDLRDLPTVLQAADGMQEVYHVAAMAGYWGAKSDFFAVNVQGTRHVLEACKKHEIPRLIYTSTPSVVIDGSHSQAMTETLPYPKRYLSHYAATKAQAEQEVLAANCDEGLRTVSLRPHLVWGPGDNHLLPRLVARARAGKLIRIGDGENRVDHCYVTNAADAHVLASAALQSGNEAAGEAFFIAHGTPIKLWDWIAELLQGLGLPPLRRSISYKTAWTLGGFMEAAYKILPLPGEPRMTRFLAMQLGSDHYFDITKAKTLLGYQPNVDYDQAMQLTTQSFLS